VLKSDLRHSTDVAPERRVPGDRQQAFVSLT
jgi:hypothetical protein